MPRFKIPTGVKIFAFIWLLILVLPPTRELFRAYFYSKYMFDPSKTVMVSTHEQLATRLHQQYPDSIEMTLWHSELTNWKQGNSRTIANLDALRKKHPNNLQIAAFEIQLMAGQVQSYRDLKRIPDYKVKVLKKAALIAFESGQKQPENVFWPLMESGFYTYANQRPQALEALKRVNRGTNYEDFRSEILKERIQFAETHESVLWEQKVSIWASMLYPYLMVFKVVCDDATAEAVKARKQGHAEQALEIMAPMLRGFGIMNRDSQTSLGPLVAEGRAYESLKLFFGQREIPDTVTYSGRQNLEKTLVQNWAQFANENGHPEFASLAEFISLERTEGEQYVYRANPGDLLGLRPPWGTVTLASTPILFWMTVLSIICGLIWSCNTIAFRHDAESNQPTRGQITSCILFSFWALCGLIASAIYLHWLNLNTFFSGYSDLSGQLFALTLPFLMVGIWFLPIYYQSQKRKLWRKKDHPIFDESNEFRPLSHANRQNRKITWATFFLSSLVVFLVNAIPVTLICFAISAVSLVMALRLEIIHQRAKRYIKSDLKTDSTIESLQARVLRLILWGAFLVCSILAMYQLRWEAQRADFILWTVLGVGSFLGAIFNEAKTNNAGFSFARKLATQSAGVFAILWGLIFLGGSIGLWPLRAELNKQWERRLIIGEVAWAKEQYERNQ